MHLKTTTKKPSRFFWDSVKNTRRVGENNNKIEVDDGRVQENKEHRLPAADDGNSKLP